MKWIENMLLYQGARKQSSQGGCFYLFNQYVAKLIVFWYIECGRNIFVFSNALITPI